jgi:hypothetical protein
LRDLVHILKIPITNIISNDSGFVNTTYIYFTLPSMLNYTTQRIVKPGHSAKRTLNLVSGWHFYKLASFLGISALSVPFQELLLFHKVRLFNFLKINHGMASAMPIEMSNRAGTITLSFGASTVKSLIFVSTSTLSGDGLATMTVM